MELRCARCTQGCYSAHPACCHPPHSGFTRENRASCWADKPQLLSFLVARLIASAFYSLLAFVPLSTQATWMQPLPSPEPAWFLRGSWH